MSCLPGMPCYEIIRTLPPCPPEINSDYIYYSGANLPATGINFKDSLTQALQKIDATITPHQLAQTVLGMIATDASLKIAFCNLVHTC